jgi:hypothetical protein
MKEIIIKLHIDDIDFLGELKTFEHVWEYSPPLKSDPREWGRIVSKHAIVKFYDTSEEIEKILFINKFKGEKV